YAPYVEKTECNYTLPACSYISLTYRGELTKTRELLPKLYEYANSHQLQLAGDAIEMCNIDDYETNHENEYIIELQI
ncbi:GyrI-like domain-containing protein, partial [Coprococcus eutactus]|uniref:GyrI-like domain-containing protein n=1 Tax=Coprococcus eutactus TaxID=33043 RepID=UPI002ED552B4|nr:transcriptional regulator [Coprococcus eutactus]